MSTTPVARPTVSIVGPGTLEGWVLFERWARPNSGVWHHAAKQAVFAELGPQDALRLLAARLLEENLHLHRLISDLHENTNSFVIPVQKQTPPSHPLPWSYLKSPQETPPERFSATVYADDSGVVCRMQGPDSEALAKFIVDSANEHKPHTPES